ncbi:MAG: endopeptidase La [Chloroflexota bacterium]
MIFNKQQIETDHWNALEIHDDIIIFESDEFIEQFKVELKEPDPVTEEALPVLPLRGIVVYPTMWLPLPIGQERSLYMIEDILPQQRLIVLVTSKQELPEEPSPEDLYTIGTVAQIHRVIKAPDGTIRLLVQGLDRVEIKEYVSVEPYLQAKVEARPERWILTPEELAEMEAKLGETVREDEELSEEELAELESTGIGDMLAESLAEPLNVGPGGIPLAGQNVRRRGLDDFERFGIVDIDVTPKHPLQSILDMDSDEVGDGEDDAQSDPLVAENEPNTDDFFDEMALPTDADREQILSADKGDEPREAGEETEGGDLDVDIARKLIKDLAGIIAIDIANRLADGLMDELDGDEDGEGHALDDDDPDQPRPHDDITLQALAHAVQELFHNLINLEPRMPEELMIMAVNVHDALHLAYLVASSLRLTIEDAQHLLEMDTVQEKLMRLIQLLKKEIEVLELGRKIQSEAHGEMEKMQRDYFLREQMKAIQKELGEEDEHTADIKELEERIEASGMTEEATKEANRELDRMRRMPIQAAEYSVIKTYLDLMVSLPWQQLTEDMLDIPNAQEILDQDHYGLEDVKERILEFLAVRKLRAERAEERTEQEEDLQDKIRREREGVVLCFVGPPGVGKTSLGVSIARAMNRKFVRLALGGIRDEADIRGFRRTYIGSMPGRIIESLRRIESRNPVFMLDEVDKIGRDFRGDPSSALLEVLDPEQNREFRDHYLDVSFDLSQVFFITTANLLDPIPGPLRDRMEIINLSSYTEDEKVKIAEGYLIPRQIKENGLRDNELEMPEDSLREIIDGYTRESGVRNLERELGKICRKIAAKVAAGIAPKDSEITQKKIIDYLGKRKIYGEEVNERTEMPGVAVGLAWTATGGDIMFFEATRVPGEKGFAVTGQLGDVMKESAQAALSYVRNRADKLGIEDDVFRKSDIHMHIPAGSIPKDGPSAGITMATALASLFSGRPVRPNLGMTGEITLRGKVLPIGGLKEKVIAAARYGINTVIIPKRNEPDLDDVPESVRERMTFIFADTVDEVLDAALTEKG